MNEAPEPGGQECPAVRVAAQTLGPARTELEPRQTLLLLSWKHRTAGVPQWVCETGWERPSSQRLPRGRGREHVPRSPAADLKAARGARPSQPPRHRPAWQFPGPAGSRGARGSREMQRPSRGPRLRGAPRDKKWGLFKAPVALVSHLLTRASRAWAPPGASVAAAHARGLCPSKAVTHEAPAEAGATPALQGVAMGPHVVGEGVWASSPNSPVWGQPHRRLRGHTCHSLHVACLKPS